MISTIDESVSLFLDALNALEEPFKSVALAATQADTEYKLKVLMKKHPDLDSIVAEAHSRLRSILAQKGINQLADLPL